MAFFCSEPGSSSWILPNTALKAANTVSPIGTQVEICSSSLDLTIYKGSSSSNSQKYTIRNLKTLPHSICTSVFPVSLYALLSLHHVGSWDTDLFMSYCDYQPPLSWPLGIPALSVCNAFTNEVSLLYSSLALHAHSLTSSWVWNPASWQSKHLPQPCVLLNARSL